MGLERDRFIFLLSLFMLNLSKSGFE